MKQFSRIGYVVKLGRYIEGMWGHLLLSIVFNLLFKITPLAHRVSTIRQADRVIVLRNGNVVGVGTYEDLMKNCEYFNQLLGGEDYAEGN